MGEKVKEVVVEKPKKLTRDYIRKKRRRKSFIGYGIAIGLLILGALTEASLGGGSGAFFVMLGIFWGFLWWRFIVRKKWASFAGKTATCYECGTDIDLVDRWTCECKDTTKRHILDKCPSCKKYTFQLNCPSCQTTLDL